MTNLLFVDERDMRRSPLGSIIRNLIEIPRHEEAYQDWIENLFHPLSHLQPGYEKPILTGKKVMANPNRKPNRSFAERMKGYANDNDK